jgi:hypothetical protein
MYMYRATFVSKVKKEKRNLKLMVRALRGRAVNGWKYLKKDKPPVNSTMSLRVDASMVQTINSIRRETRRATAPHSHSHSQSQDSSSGNTMNENGGIVWSSSDQSIENENGINTMDELGMMIGSRILPDGWEEFLDATSGFFFWVNEATGESSWEPPNGMQGVDPNPIVVARQSQLDQRSPMRDRIDM